MSDPQPKRPGRPRTTGRGVNPQVKFAVSDSERARLDRFGKVAGLRRAVATLNSVALWVDPSPEDLPEQLMGVVPPGASRVILLSPGKPIPMEWSGAEEADTSLGRVAWMMVPP